MNIEILQHGRVLRRYNHDGRHYIETPPEGDYQIRLTNPTSRRRMVVLSVDGINVVDGSKAAHDGPGYVLKAWESILVKGWRRSDSKVAAFNFTTQGGSLSAQTGRGTKNTGVIGIAVFDEKEKPQPVIIPPIVIHEHHHYPKASTWPNTWPNTPPGPVCRGVDTLSNSDTTYGCDEINILSEEKARARRPEMYGDMCADGMDDPDNIDMELCCESSMGSGGKEKLTKGSPLRSRRVQANKPAADIATGYGQETTMYTQTTEFDRATTSPAQAIVLHYGVREKLIEWGVPVTETPSADPFPASTGPSVAPPPGWRG